jgi:hypothetical protein
MLQIKIAARQSVNPEQDPMGRTWVGYTPGMSEEDAWEAGRGCWVMKASRAIDEDEVQIVSGEGTILAVATMRGLIKHGNRLEIIGDLQKGHERVGTVAGHVSKSQNPISYL